MSQHTSRLPTMAGRPQVVVVAPPEMSVIGEDAIAADGLQTTTTVQLQLQQPPEVEHDPPVSSSVVAVPNNKPHCHSCNKHFASKQTLQRHALRGCKGASLDVAQCVVGTEAWRNALKVAEQKATELLNQDEDNSKPTVKLFDHVKQSITRSDVAHLLRNVVVFASGIGRNRRLFDFAVTVHCCQKSQPANSCVWDRLLALLTIIVLSWYSVEQWCMAEGVHPFVAAFT